VAMPEFTKLQSAAHASGWLPLLQVILGTSAHRPGSNSIQVTSLPVGRRAHVLLIFSGVRTRGPLD